MHLASETSALNGVKQSARNIAPVPANDGDEATTFVLHRASHLQTASPVGGKFAATNVMPDNNPKTIFVQSCVVTMVKICSSTSRLLSNFMGSAHLLDESVVTVVATKDHFESHATLDETHEYTNHTGLYVSTVQAEGTCECMTTANGALKVHVTMGRRTGHTVVLERTAKGRNKPQGQHILGLRLTLQWVVSVVHMPSQVFAEQTCQVPQCCRDSTAVSTQVTDGSEAQAFDGVPHAPLKRSVPPGKSDGEYATNSLIDSVSHSSMAGYAVIAVGDVPGDFDRTCTSHVISEDNTMEVTVCSVIVSKWSKRYTYHITRQKNHPPKAANRLPYLH